MKNRFKHYETRTHIGRICPPSFICSFLPSIHFFPLFISFLCAFLPSVHFFLLFIFSLCSLLHLPISSICSFIPFVYFFLLFISFLCPFLPLHLHLSGCTSSMSHQSLRSIRPSFHPLQFDRSPFTSFCLPVYKSVGASFCLSFLSVFVSVLLGGMYMYTDWIVVLSPRRLRSLVRSVRCSASSDSDGRNMRRR